MWFIWLMVFLMLCLVGMAVFWIGHKIWISAKREERKFQKECENTEVKENA